jgi:tripartite-type tricarboxylate transporter receptor subunit TctC
MEDPEVVKRLASGGADVVTSTSPEEFAVFLRNQTAFWAKIVKDVGATAE